MTFQPSTATVKHDGMDLCLRFEACRINMGGEFAGNVEVQIGCDPDLLGILVDHLRLGVTGVPHDGVIATRSTDEGVVVGFHSETLLGLRAIPEQFSLFWEDERIGAVEPTLVHSVPVENVYPLVDAGQILARPATPISTRVRFAGPGRPLWLIPAIIFAVFGAMFVVAHQPFGALDGSYNKIAGAVLIALGVATAAAELLIPRSEIWYEHNLRRFSVVSSRRIFGSRDLAQAEHHELDEFVHVRIFEMSSWDSDHEAQTRWTVSLEGPVRYASEDGYVHRRSDAFQLRACSSARAARRLAAEVAHHTGLRILDTGDRTA